MGYTDLKLEDIALPADTVVKPDTEWRYELVPGIGIYIQNVTKENITQPMTMVDDSSTGMLYGVYLDSDNEAVDNIFWNFAKKYATESSFSMVAYLLEQIQFDKVFPEASVVDNAGFMCFWTHNREQFTALRDALTNALRKGINESMPELPPEIIKKIEDGRNDVTTGAIWAYRVRNRLLNAVDINKLTKRSIRQFVFNGIYYKSLSDMYTKVAKKEIPQRIEESLKKAMDVYKKSYGTENYLEIVFDASNGKIDFNTKNGKAIYTSKVSVIKLAAEWKAKGNYEKDIKGFVDKVIKKLEDKSDLFKDILNLTIELNYNNITDLGVVFEAKMCDKPCYYKYTKENYNGYLYIDYENLRFMLLSMRDGSIYHVISNTVEGTKDKLDEELGWYKRSILLGYEIEEQGECTLADVQAMLATFKPKEETPEKKQYNELIYKYENDDIKEVNKLYWDKAFKLSGKVYNGIVEGIKAFEKHLTAEQKKESHTLDIMISLGRYGVDVDCEDMDFEYFYPIGIDMIECSAMLEVLEENKDSYLVKSQEVFHWIEDAMSGIFDNKKITKLDLDYEIGDDSYYQ